VHELPKFEPELTKYHGVPLALVTDASETTGLEPPVLPWQIHALEPRDTQSAGVIVSGFVADKPKAILKVELSVIGAPVVLEGGMAAVMVHVAPTVVTVCVHGVVVVVPFTVCV
jgi:hypothetical protein